MATNSPGRPETEHLTVTSKLTNQQLRVIVSPGEPDATTLYVLDPVFLLDLAIGTRALLAAGARLTGGGFQPPTIVGVGYPTDDPAEVMALRARDLTPTGNPSDGFGGASAFLEALADEVIPAVEAAQPISGQPRILVGFSFGALFGLYSLFQRPELFAGYLLGSPSLWWDSGLAFTWEQDWAAAHDDLAARVFLFAGANEQSYPAEVWMNQRFSPAALQQLEMVDSLNRLVTELGGRGYPSLHLDTAVLDGEFHLTAPAAALARGMLSIIDGAAT